MTYAEFATFAASLPYLFLDGTHTAIDDVYDLNHCLTDEEQEVYDSFYDLLAGYTVELIDATLCVGYLDEGGQWSDAWDD